MIRVLLVSDKPDDSIAFYRSTMPWNQIQKEYDDVYVTVKHPTEAFTWNLITAHDVLFISNPRTQKHLDIIKVAKSYGVKVWSDYDDCFFISSGLHPKVLRKIEHKLVYVRSPYARNKSKL